MIHFDLLLPASGMPGSVWATVDVLRHLNLVERVRSPRAKSPAFSWRVIDERRRAHRFHALTCNDDQERRHSRTVDGAHRVLVVPPLDLRAGPALMKVVRRSTKAVELITRAYDEGALVGACGSGVWLLAQSGRLKRAPVPYVYQSGFSSLFPKVELEPIDPIVMHDRIACASMPSLLYPLILRLVQLAGMADLAKAGAETLLPNFERQEIAATMTAGELMGISRDMPLYLAIEWMKSHAGRPFCMSEVAVAASVSERTLSRIFRQHINQTPLQFVQTFRVSRAKMWLESTWRSVSEIAQDCGYRDTSAFCRMFIRTTGSSPQRYRERYTLRGPRALWKSRDGEEPPIPGA